MSAITPKYAKMPAPTKNIAIPIGEFQPKIRGVYAKHLLTNTDLPYVEPEIDAVFLSHAHCDHIDHLPFLDPEIPVFLGAGTKLFMEAAERTSGYRDYGDHEYQTFRTGDQIEVGDITVEPIHVDHSIPAAYAFLLHTTGGAIVYTGDLRAHGPRNDMTEEFAEKASECEPVAMICEGTRMVEVDNRQSYSEEQVKESSNEIVSSTDKIGFITRYSRDMDRFRSFYQIARDNGRKIAISPKSAYLLNLLVEDKRLHLPDPLKDNYISVYYKRKRSGEFDERDYYIWERDFMNKMVTHEYIHKHQSELVMDLDFYQFAELIDIKPDRGSHFIHSMSEPFSEEDIEDQVMHNWLDHFQMHFHQLHASGHMNKQQIMELINYVNPKKVFPLHTEDQMYFKKKCDRIQIIECRKEYSL